MRNAIRVRGAAKLRRTISYATIIQFCCFLRRSRKSLEGPPAEADRLPHAAAHPQERCARDDLAAETLPQRFCRDGIASTTSFQRIWTWRMRCDKFRSTELNATTMSRWIRPRQVWQQCCRRTWSSWKRGAALGSYWSYISSSKYQKSRKWKKLEVIRFKQDNQSQKLRQNIVRIFDHKLAPKYYGNWSEKVQKYIMVILNQLL